MSPDIPQIKQAREAERRRLRDLPWPEKLEMLDKLRDRHLWLRRMRRESAGAVQEAPGKHPDCRLGSGPDGASRSARSATGPPAPPPISRGALYSAREKRPAILHGGVVAGGQGEG